MLNTNISTGKQRRSIVNGHVVDAGACAASASAFAVMSVSSGGLLATSGAEAVLQRWANSRIALTVMSSMGSTAIGGATLAVTLSWANIALLFLGIAGLAIAANNERTPLERWAGRTFFSKGPNRFDSAEDEDTGFRHALGIAHKAEVAPSVQA